MQCQFAVGSSGNNPPREHRNPHPHLGHTNQLLRLPGGRQCCGREQVSLRLSHTDTELGATSDRKPIAEWPRTQSQGLCTHRKHIHTSPRAHPASTLPVLTASHGGQVPTTRHPRSLGTPRRAGSIPGGLASVQNRNVSLGLCKLPGLSAVRGWRSQFSIPPSITLFDWHFNEGAGGRPPARGPVHAPFISQSM